VARGAVRGALGAWLGLITLQVVSSRGGSGKVAGAFDAVNSIVKRSLSPDVAAIPDYRDGVPAVSNPDAPSFGAAPASKQLPAAAVTYVGGSIPVPSGTAGRTRPI
jgi:hypothetical protein